MYYLSNFARPQGSKDKQKRKPKSLTRKVLEGSAIGGGALGAVGALGSNNILNEVARQAYLQDNWGISFLEPKEQIEEGWKTLKEQPEALKKIRNIRKGVIGSSIALGGSLGALGIYLRNKNKNKKRGS
jgi:hypothetical protein